MVVWGRVSDPSIPGKTLRSTLARVGTATLAPRSAVKGRVPDGCVGRVSDPFRPSEARRSNARQLLARIRLPQKCRRTFCGSRILAKSCRALLRRASLGMDGGGGRPHVSNSAPSVLLGLNGSETRPTQPSETPSFTADRGARVDVPTRARVLLSVLPGMDGSETRPHTTIRDPSLHTGRIAGEGARAT